MWQLSTNQGTVRLRPHLRVDGAWSTLASLDLSAFVSVTELSQGRHRLRVTTSPSATENFVKLTTWLDADKFDEREVRVDSIPRGGIGFRVDKHSAVDLEKYTIHGVTVTTPGGRVLFDPDFASTGRGSKS